MSIKAKISALEFFQSNAEEIVLGLVAEEEQIVVGLNTDVQLFGEGVNNQGKDLEPPYRPLTIRLKRLKGQPTDRVTLKDTGRFHASFYLRFGRDYFIIVADDRKAGKLEKKYGLEIYGLTDENIQEVIDLIKDPLREQFKKAVQ